MNTYYKISYRNMILVLMRTALATRRNKRKYLHIFFPGNELIIMSFEKEKNDTLILLFTAYEYGFSFLMTRYIYYFVKDEFGTRSY